jgi:hypothetical protein
VAAHDELYFSEVYWMPSGDVCTKNVKSASERTLSCLLNTGAKTQDDQEKLFVDGTMLG